MTVLFHLKNRWVQTALNHSEFRSRSQLFRVIHQNDRNPGDVSYIEVERVRETDGYQTDRQAGNLPSEVSSTEG